MDLKRIKAILEKNLENEPYRREIIDIINEVLIWEISKLENQRPHGAREEFLRLIEERIGK